MRRFATFFKGFAKGFFKITKVIKKIPNEFGTLTLTLNRNVNASHSLAVKNEEYHQPQNVASV